MTITELPPQAARSSPVSGPPDPVSDAPPTVSDAPPTASDAPEGGSRSDWWLERLLWLVGTLGGLLVGAIGFVMSYDTLSTKALSWGFSADLAPWFPVGVDASIVAFLALDLHMIRKGCPWPVLRLAAHVMTGATVWFNAASQGSIGADPVQAAAHAVTPILFVLGVEAARRRVIKKARIEAGTHTDRIPLHRWILSPWATPKLYRRMRLYNITSYPEMIRRGQELIAYELWLKRKYDGDLSKASEDEMLPMTMAPYGYDVAEALAMPAEQERAAEERREEAERRQVEAETRRQLAERRAEAERIRAQAALEVAQAQAGAEAERARAQARADVTAAERAAMLEDQALETATIAEARARTAKAEREEAEERAREAEANRAAAEQQRLAEEERRAAEAAATVAELEARAVETAAMAEARKRAAEADKAAAEIERDAAETRRRAAEIDAEQAEAAARQEAAIAQARQQRQAAAEAEQAAAETRRRAAEIEAAAIEMEDAARLSPRERAARKVARMVLAHADGESERLPLDAITEAFGVAFSTASEYRNEAAALLASGYRPAA
ncbi:DUF2637 domain-containing protein [Streptodolium elevatio]